MNVRMITKFVIIIYFVCVPLSELHIIGRYLFFIHNSCSAEVIIAMKMSACTTYLVFSAVFWVTVYAQSAHPSDKLQPDLPLKDCHDEVSSVAVTNTRLDVTTALLTITLMDIKPTYVTVTTTECEPYIVTQMEILSKYEVPQLVSTTNYVTEFQIYHKTVVFTSSNYQQQTISITHSAMEVETMLAETMGRTISTVKPQVTTVETLTSSVTKTITKIQTDTSTYVTYVPIYVTRTMTSEWPIYQTVYQKEFVKESIDIVTTVTETATAFHCSVGYLRSLFGG